MSAFRRWLVIAVVVPCSIVTLGAVFIVFTIAGPAWAKDFAASHGEISLALTLCILGQGAVSPIAGSLVGRLSIRTLLLIGLAMTVAGLVLVGLATAMWQITALYLVLLAAGTVLTGPVITTVLAVRLFPEAKGLATGVVTTALGFTSFIMPPIITALITARGWRFTDFVFAAVCLVVLAPLLFLFVRETAEAPADPAAEEPVPEPTMSLADILKDRIFWGVSLAFMPLLFIFNGIYYNTGFLLADQGGTAAQTTVILSAAGFSALPGIILYGYLADRLKHLPLFAVSVLIIATAASISALFASYGVLVVSLTTWTFFQGGVITLMPVIFATRFGPVNFARAVGAGGVLQALVIFGTTAASVGRDLLGSYHAAYSVMLIVIPFSLAALLLLRPNRRTGTEATGALAAS